MTRNGILSRVGRMLGKLRDARSWLNQCRFRADLLLIALEIRAKSSKDGLLATHDASRLSARLRVAVTRRCGAPGGTERLQHLLSEVRVLIQQAEDLKPIFQKLYSRRVLYVGQCYYHPWYLSRALRNNGWIADVLNWDISEGSQIFYHGEDVRFTQGNPYDYLRDLEFFLISIYRYDLFHFSNMLGITFGYRLYDLLKNNAGLDSEVSLLRLLGKKIVYSNNGCQDGATQTGFASWGDEPVCNICVWRDKPLVCGDERNARWGKFRNEVTDYQCTIGGNRVDYNVTPSNHEVPEFYCMDPNLWHPDIEVPHQFRVNAPPETILLYHAVANRDLRTTAQNINIKSSHIYIPLVNKLVGEGIPLQLLSPTGIPNREVRFIQAQADIFLEMLSFGWFGANGREALMLGKPVICFLRPEWLTSIRKELPDYVEELPVISATSETVEGILRDLIANPEKRQEIGRRSRQFALKWHSAQAGSNRFDKIYTKLLQGDTQYIQ